VVTRDWGKLYTEYLTNFILHQIKNQIKKSEMGGTCNKHSESRDAYRVSVGMPGLRRPLLMYVLHVVTL
jgi:hypothetical protein